MGFAFRLPLTLVLAALTAGCGVAASTGMLRDDALTDAQQAISGIKIDSGGLKITGSVDRSDTSYAVDQPITLSVKVSKDAHVAILRVLPNGDTTLVFPNKAHPASDVAANVPLIVPAPGEGVTITGGGKPGIVLFEFVASTEATSWLFKRAPDKGSDFANLGVTSRAIAKDATGSLKAGKHPDTAAAFVTVRVGGGLF